ncbi:hypothetical protein BUALT_Bualt10G0017200 [Buddleja alternifolia]|uniref:GATA transcription factor 26 n=1 Tax=Buddleja alternifolia TaxID=168488 RepID=A0AAV6X3W7_9LAMI|nr:hypothetical protein BUALT_Bualt10G0017200 [Buddleja alternifolia]
MGKHGPCCHCGVTSTPLWRNGPPEKPVLCNACGSRWRTKGTLVNYTPLHARAEPDDFEDRRFSKAKTVSIKNKETKILKRKFDNYIPEVGVFPPDYSHGFRKGFDEDTSNRSSSGSAISNTESCAQYGSADASDLTGPSQPIIWDSTVPSRKRTCVSRAKPSPVEKLTKDLYTIWHEQQASCLSGSSEEDLLLESDKPMVSVEIGHGSVLIRHPNSIAREEESEASSFSIDNKQDTLNSSSKGIEKIKKLANQWAEPQRIRSFRDKDQLEKLQILAQHNSPLCYIDLQDILNYETFSSHLTNDEQHQLLKFLPSVDTLQDPHRNTVSMSSLKSMFDSPQFKENLLSFQTLLADGVFDNSFCGGNTEDCRDFMKLIFCSSTKSKWVEQYNNFKDLKCKNSISESDFVGEFNAFETEHSASTKRSRDGQHGKLAGAKVIMKSPRNIIMKNSSSDQKEVIDKDGSFLRAKSLLSIQNDNISLVLDSSHFTGESCDQDLLLDIPSNGFLPQAELLLPSSGFSALASTSSSSVYPNLVHR